MKPAIDCLAEEWLILQKLLYRDPIVPQAKLADIERQKSTNWFKNWKRMALKCQKMVKRFWKQPLQLWGSGVPRQACCERLKQWLTRRNATKGIERSTIWIHQKPEHLAHLQWNSEATMSVFKKCPPSGTILTPKVVSVDANYSF